MFVSYRHRAIARRLIFGAIVASLLAIGLKTIKAQEPQERDKRPAVERVVVTVADGYIVTEIERTNPDGGVTSIRRVQSLEGGIESVIVYYPGICAYLEPYGWYWYFFDCANAEGGGR